MGPLALYLHFPFCKNICRYCDFYKIAYDKNNSRRLLRAVEYETDMVFSSLGYEPIEVASIYIGGGTPSLVDPDLLERWLDHLREYINFAPDYEFTIETNPESLSDDFARRTFRMGVNRLIVGVQSFQISALETLGRRLRPKDIYKAFYLARVAGYKNIGADLIFGLPGQKIKQVKSDIERLSSLEPTHISFYQLTVEKGTPLADDIASGKVVLPDEDQLAAMYRYGAHMLIDNGFRRYEVSNFAPIEYRSRHNYAYWNGSPYIALGPAAHGYVNETRYANVADAAKYMEMIEAGQLPFAFTEELTNDQKLMETVMLSLRTTEGIDKEMLKIRYGNQAEKILSGRAATRYIETGHLLDESGFLRLTDAGFLLADAIITDLIESVGSESA